MSQVRLFRRHPQIRWQYRVHEQILISIRQSGGVLSPTDIVIHHSGFADPALQQPKVERNWRLLQLEVQDHPDDPFVLYNLGAVAISRGQHLEALDYLRRSLQKSNPEDTLVPKLYTLLTRGHHQTGQKDEARAVCRKGRQLFPHDGELLFWEATLLQEQGNLDEAARCLEQVLQGQPGQDFAGADAGLHSYRSRHFLADIYRQLGRLPDAEVQWQRVVGDCPHFAPAWRGLADLFLQQGRWAELEGVLTSLDADTGEALHCVLLRGRLALVRKDFAQARRQTEAAIARFPEAVNLRILLSHALLQEGKDWQAAEQALLDLLTLDPFNGEAAHNLRTLLQQQGRATPREERPGETVAVPDVILEPITPAGPLVSLCMMVKNEEHNLAACLDSVADLVGEICIADTGSTDRTKEIAARFGAHVIDFPWVDSFAAARNASMRDARGQSILWLDADDRLDEANRNKLRLLFELLQEGNVGYVMKCLCLPDKDTGTATVVDHLRLFRRHGGLRWTYRIHEQILPSFKQHGGEVRWSDVVIHHTGYQDPATRKVKRKRDLRLLQLEYAEDPEAPFSLFNLGSLFQEMGRKIEAVRFFRASLERSAKSDSIVRKLYASIAQCHNQLGQSQEALAVCREGRKHFPEDRELLFQEGVILRGLGQREEAVRCWKQTLACPKGQHFASVHTGLAGYLTRVNLASAYREQGQTVEAERQWLLALEERPGYEPAWRGLAELYLSQQRFGDLEGLAVTLENSSVTLAARDGQRHT